MSNSPAVYREKRSVSYLAPTRVVWKSSGVRGAERLKDVAGETATIWRAPGAQIPPGGSVILEYDTVEPLQGVRISRGRDVAGPVNARIRFGESVSEVVNTPNNDHSMHDIVLPLSAMGIGRVGNTGFRFLRLDNLDEKATLNLREISAEAWTHPAKRVGFFECSDERLNAIYEACFTTLNKCISPLLLDGTKRDRLVWMGDLYNEIRACGVLYRRHSAIPESLEFLNEEALVNKYFNGIPSYTAYWFLSQREYHRFFADDKFLRSQRKPFVFFSKLLFDSFDNDPDSVMHGEIVDWGAVERTPADSYGPLYLAAVQACGELAELFGEAKILADARRVAREVARRHVKSSRPKSAAAWAALTGLEKPRDVFRRVLSVNPRSELSTFHFDNYLKVYTMAGKTQEALDLLREYYGGMLELGSRTIWEQFDLEWAKGAGRIDEMPRRGRRDIHLESGAGCFQGLRNSLCHGWGASPMAWLVETITGITPVGDGYSGGVKVTPNLCDLDCATAVCPTPMGEVTVIARRGDKPVVLAPEGMKVFR